MFLRIAKILLLLLVFSLCYIQPFVQLFNFQIPPTEFIFLLTFTFWILAILTRQTKFRFHRFYWLLLFYFGAMLVSACFSDNRQISFIKLCGEIYLLWLPVLIFNLVESKSDIKRLVLTWIAAAGLAVLLGIFSIALFYFNRESWLLNYTVHSYGAVPVGNYPRLRIHFLSPSLLCNYLSVSFSLLLIALKMNWIKKSFSLIFAALGALIAVFTFSSGLGGFAVICGLWGFYNYQNENKKFARLSLYGGIMTAIFFLMLNVVALQSHSTASFTVNFAGREFQPSPRVMIWQAASETFRENFLFGRGVGQDSCKVVFQDTDGNFAVLTDAHNIFLSVASQSGVFGLVAVILIIIYLLKDVPFNFSPDKSSIISAGLWTAFISAFVYQGLVGSFEDTRHLWTLIGLMLCANDLAHSP